MAVDLKQYLENIALQRLPVWVDAWDYGSQLICKGQQVPWSNIAATIAYIKQLQSLVNSDVMTLDLGNFYNDWLENNPGLLKAMAEKRRLGYALSTMLADPESRKVLEGIINAVRTSYSNKPVVLAIPSPKLWMAKAYCAAKGVGAVDISWEDAESAAMYVADFLRCFSSCEIDGLLIKDEAECGPSSDADLARYQPVLNVAENYCWHIVLDGSHVDYLPKANLGISFLLQEKLSQVLISKEQISSEQATTALKLTPDYWNEKYIPVIPEIAFCYVRVPTNAVPETVLEKLTALRQSYMLSNELSKEA